MERYTSSWRNRNKTNVTPETRAYVEWAREKRMQDEKRATPLEWLGNLFSVGSNMTANTAENVMQAIQGRSVPFSEYIGDLAKSFTPEGANSWTKVFWGDEKDQNYQGMFGTGGTAGGDGTFGTRAFRGITGFLGDAVLDPANLVSFGSTKAAKAAAKSAAEAKMVSMAMDPIRSSIVRSGIDRGVLKGMMDSGKIDDAVRYIGKYAKEGVFERAYNDAYKEALRKGSTELKRDFLHSLNGKVYNPQEDMVKSRIGAWLDEYQGALEKKVDDLSFDKLNKLPKAQRLAQEKLRDKLLTKIDYIKGSRDKFENEILNVVHDTMTGNPINKKGIKSNTVREMVFDQSNGLMRSLQNSEIWGKINLKEWDNPLANFDHAGESALRIFRKEIGTGTHAGYNSAMQQWDAFKKTLGNKQLPLSPTKQTYSQAWWSLMNNSPIGRIRRVLGFDNPYREMLKIKERDASEAAQSSIQQSVTAMKSKIDMFDDDTKLDYVLMKGLKEKMGKRSEKIAAMDFATFVNATKGKVEKATKHAINDTPDAVQNLAKLDKEVSDIFSKLHETEVMWSGMGAGAESGELSDYLAFVSQHYEGRQVGPGKTIGPYEQSFQKVKSKGIFNTVKDNVTSLRELAGLDNDDINTLLEENKLPVNLNLDEILASRIIKHHNYGNRASLIEAFKPFGIEESEQVLIGKNIRKEEFFTKLGLNRVNDPSLQGYLFDDSTASIIDRTMKLASNDPDIQELKSVFDKYTHYWKTMVTGNPGFHMRNFYSNMATLFQQHGLNALDTDTANDAFVATMVGLEGVEGAAKRIGGRVEHINSVLAKNYGGKTLGELAQYAREKGVISMSYGGRDTKEAVTDLLGTAENGAVEKAGKFSRNVGAHIESFAKMDSFLLGVKNMTKDDMVTDGMIDYAKNEAKKWFIDYENLTEFERTKMKTVFPFYTWLRRNIANQVGQAMAIENWPMMSLPRKFFDAMKDRTVDTSKMPGYVRDEGGIPIGRDEDDNIIYMYPQLPMNDLNKLPIRGGGSLGEVLGNSGKALITTLLDSAHPMIKAGISVGKALTKRSGEDKLKESNDVVNFGLSIADSVLRLTGSSAFERGDNGRIMVDPDVLDAVNALRPEINLINRLYSVGKAATLVAPLNTDEIFDAVAAEKTKADKVRAFWNAMSFTLGIRGANLDEDEERYKRAQGIYYDALREKQEAERSSGAYKTRSNKYKRSMMRTYRRMGIL